MKRFLFSWVLQLALFILLFAAIGHSVSFWRSIAVAGVVVLFKIHQVYEIAWFG